MSFSFQKQLQVGAAGEAVFSEIYVPRLVKIEKNWGDFRREDGRILELKTDTYPMSKTKNFFIERWSREGVPGGPWQAYEKGATVFVYFYVQDGTYFEFTELWPLLMRLEALIGGLECVHVHNKTWTTTGYKVPRELLKDLYKAHKIT